MQNPLKVFQLTNLKFYVCFLEMALLKFSCYKCVCAFFNVVCLQLTSKESIQGFIMAFAVKIT